MKTRYTVMLLLLGLILPTGEAVGQQAAPTLHRYMVRAVLTAEGLKNLQKQPPFHRTERTLLRWSVSHQHRGRYLLRMLFFKGR